MAAGPSQSVVTSRPGPHGGGGEVFTTVDNGLGSHLHVRIQPCPHSPKTVAAAPCLEVNILFSVCSHRQFVFHQYRLGQPHAAETHTRLIILPQGNHSQLTNIFVFSGSENEQSVKLKKTQFNLPSLTSKWAWFPQTVEKLTRPKQNIVSFVRDCRIV